MKKTALTQLIDELDNGLWNAREVVNYSDDYHTGDVKKAIQEIRIIEGVIEMATELLEVERQDIENAWVAAEGTFHDAGTELKEAEKYFNETFKQ